jgi:glycosyltransferase involved in cell wall biosynthesis
MLTQIEAFEPQIIYTMLGANTVLRLVRDVHARCGVPIVPHIMDDWPSTLYRSSIFRPILRPRMKAGWRMVLAHAPLKLTIGQDMADEYSRRYGGTFTPFMNAVEPEFLVRSPTLVEARRTVRVTYVGGLHLGRWQSLLDIGAALEALQSEGHDAELLIYTQPRFESEAKRLSLPGVIRVVGSLAPSDVPAVLRSADILVHVESFNSRARKYARYSISTKIPECMGASRPVLAYGPDELASIRYVSNSGAGVSVGRRDRKELIQALRTLLDSAALREELGGRGLEVASRYHHAEGQREQLRSMLAAIATKEVGVDARTGP